MKTRTIILLLAGLFVLPLAVNAQVGGLLKRGVNTAMKTATKTVEKQINKEIEKAVERRVLAAFDRARRNNGDTTSTSGGYWATGSGSGSGGTGSGSGGGRSLASMGLGFGEVTLKYNDTYKFSGRIVMEMETFSEGESNGKLLYTILYNENSLSSAIEMKDISKESEDGNATFIFDLENKCFLMLSESDGQKSGLISPIADESISQPEPEVTEPADVAVDDTYLGAYKKTGRSKTIAGYKCDEYVASYPENEVETSMWFTRDMKQKLNSRGMATAGIPGWYSGSYIYGGYMMEMESREKGKVTSTMVTREINNSANVDVDCRGYELIQMNSTK
ncbi:MAG: hypothetical protein IH591_17405 [Bacteroidales bacterium]|nr:hypothetical protein [Bacteroidales bacterium]